MELGKILCSLGLILLTAGPLHASFLRLSDDVKGDKPEVQILQRDADQIQFEVRLPGIEILNGELDGRRWDRVEIPGGGFEMNPGVPEVPHFTRLLAIPATAGVHAEFEAVESGILPNIELMPAQGIDPEDLRDSGRPVHFDMAAYSRNAFYPEQWIDTGEPAVMRGVRLIALKMNPVQYNPVTKELRVVHRYRVKVRFKGTDWRNVPQRQVPISRTWAKLMSASLINTDDLDVDEEAMGSYLIVCQNAANLIDNLQPLIEWKTRKGHFVALETFPSGYSSSQIKAIIQNAYNTWEIPPEYVLLVGDTGGTYTLAGWSPSGIDHPYSQLDGSDILADVAVGRLPVENDYETIVMVNKVLYYEKIPYTANSDWYHQGVLVAGSSSSGISTVQINRWIKTRMIWNEYTRIDTFWYYMSGSAPTVISNAINNGVTYFNYRGYWGISGWDNYDIDQLYNGRKLPFCSVITCGTGGFDGDSNMEHFVSVGTPSTPKGAVACVGTATLSTNTHCNNTVNVGIFAGIFDEGITQAGNALNRGKLELYNAYQANFSGGVSNFSLWNALAGDPGLELFTSAIQFMSSDVPATVTWGENSLSLTVNETGVGPLEGATVCLYKSGELHEVGLTDASGQITLPLNANTIGNVKVTITKQNFYPIVDSLDVVQAGVAVGYFGHMIDDDNIGSSSGDGDGIINPGETVEIPLVFRNYGSSITATGVSVMADETDAYASLTDNYETFPDIAPGATANSGDDFDLAVAPNCPHGHTVRLNLTTTAVQGSWDGVMDLEVVSFDMTTLSAIASGGDTLLSPGETANLILTVRNNGGKSAASLTAMMTSLDAYVTVNDGSAGFGTVNVGAAANCSSNPFNLTANISAPPGHMADLAVTFSANGAAQSGTITIQLGNKTSTDPQGPDEYGYYCYDNTDLGYPQAPFYSWVEIDPSYGGSGTQLPINDTGENQDASAVVTLPFTFRYYGQTVNQITVCSNGWIATNPDASFTDFRNYPIPSAMGPTGQIAAFWDDLITDSQGHVFGWSDVAGHRFIVEWSRMKNFGSPQPRETFEIILYDPIYYPTPTGDGEILFQYESITEVTGSYDDNPYSTVGIERPDHQDGIEVVYWNTYDDPAAAHLQSGRAYFFTTAFEQGGEPPVIGVSPSSLTINVPEGGFGSDQLTISNTGGSTLIFNTSFSYEFQDDAGGPDNFGYTWVDSDEPGGPQYDWVDISGIGTPITFVHNDSTSAEFPLGFDFPFYGTMQSSYIISANGWVSFSSHSGVYNNTTLPNPSAPLDLLAGFWDDLDPLQSGAQVLTWNNGLDSLVVSFLAVPHWGTSVVGTYTFQIIISAEGTITYQYQTLTGDYTSCTVGIQNGDGTDGLQVAYNQTYLHNNLAVRFDHPFLRAVPPSGGVPPGANLDVEIIGYGYGMSAGTYAATLGIDSNDPQTPHVDVPLTIVIGGQPPAPLQVTMTPQSPPIVIPPSGGSFGYTAAVANLSSSTQQFDFWILVRLPDSTVYGPVLLRPDLSLPTGNSISRSMTQQVPGGAPAGSYYYYGNAGSYPDSVISTDGFSFTKSAGLNGGNGSGEWTLSGWEDVVSEIPSQFAFRGCYPNPFNPMTRLAFDLPNASKVTLQVFDLMGRKTATLVDGWREAGTHEVTFDGSGLPSGVYIYRLRAGQYTASGKMVLMK